MTCRTGKDQSAAATLVFRVGGVKMPMSKGSEVKVERGGTAGGEGKEDVGEAPLTAVGEGEKGGELKISWSIYNNSTPSNYGKTYKITIKDMHKKNFKISPTLANYKLRRRQRNKI